MKMIPFIKGVDLLYHDCTFDEASEQRAIIDHLSQHYPACRHHCKTGGRKKTDDRTFLLNTTIYIRCWWSKNPFSHPVFWPLKKNYCHRTLIRAAHSSSTPAIRQSPPWWSFRSPCLPRRLQYVYHFPLAVFWFFLSFPDAMISVAFQIVFFNFIILDGSAE